jgi:LCP family protein required for cell wall assembly
MTTPQPALPPELNPRGPARGQRLRRSTTAGSAGAPRLAPMRPGGRRRRWITAVTGALAAAVLGFSVIGSGLAGYYDSQVTRVDVITPQSPGSAGSGGSGTATDSGVAQNFLLVGSDSRAGLTKAEIDALHVGSATTTNAAGRRSDTMILLHLSAKSDKATLISLPRDSYVEIPAYTDDQGVQHPASHNKLNAAYAFGGAKLTVQTVELATGVHIDHYIEIGFDGFVKMVNALGGINVCSTTSLVDPKSGLNIKAGITRLDGPKALAYVRARYVDPTADLGRMKRQQAFLGSMFRSALSTQVLLNPLKLNSFLTATLSSVTLDTGLSRDDLLSLATRTHGLAPSNVVFATVPLSDVNYQPGGGLGSTVLWSPSRSKALFTAINQDVAIGSQSAPTATTAAAPTVAVAPSKINVQVLNGGGVAGLGAKANADLVAQGYLSAGPAKNATQTGVTTTQILYDPRYDVSVKTLEAAFPGAVVTPVVGQGKVFQVIVGTSYAAPKAVKVSSAAGSGGNSPGGVVTTSAAQTVCSTTS